MKSILNIQIQKLFIVTIVLKVGSSFLGWRLGSPWLLGFTIPLAIMVAYIVIGLNRRDTSVSDEKFADSCYYVGFIFTITSIIFSLFDLPNIGTKIQDIAVRFGAAMISTVMGLVVRVWLVSFKKDVGDAVREVEDSVIDASQKFRHQLEIAYEKMLEFQLGVDNAAKETVELVKIQVETLSINYAQQLEGFFIDLTKRNQEAFADALGEVKSSSIRLAESVDQYSHGMRANLTGIEARIDEFADAVSHRLEATSFPDDYFSQRLEAPLANLSSCASDISDNVKTVASQVKDSTGILTDTLKKLRTKATAVEGALDKVINLTMQQESVLASSQGQLNVLEEITSTLAGIDNAMVQTVAAINDINMASSELAGTVVSASASDKEMRLDLSSRLSEILESLKENVSASQSMIKRIERNTLALDRITETINRPNIENVDSYRSTNTTHGENQIKPNIPASREDNIGHSLWNKATTKLTGWKAGSSVVDKEDSFESGSSAEIRNYSQGSHESLGEQADTASPSSVVDMSDRNVVIKPGNSE